MNAERRGPAIGIDVGGTFTDFVAADPAGRLLFHKEPSTPSDPSLAVERGLVALRERGVGDLGAGLIVHGTTIALNATLQRRGAPIALVVSRGNRDVLEIARCRMPSSFNFLLGKEPPIVPRDRVFEVDARMNAEGVVLARPSSAELDRLCAALARLDVEAVAVSLLNAYLDGSLETEVAGGIAARLPGLLVTRSSAVWPEIREYERAVAAALNAQIHPLMERYLETLQRRIATIGRPGGLAITTSSGGTLGLATARARPIETMLSGPASGVTAAARLAADAGLGAVITFDMGGTSADIAVVSDGRPDTTTATTIGDLPLMLPVIAVSSIGAGGGSILSIDAQGVLKVGPESAGAHPGPVAYGEGGTAPTVTDCYLATGLLDPDRFLGGRVRLDRAAAETALDTVARRLGVAGPAEAAEAALRVTTARMATELFKLLAQKGLDPREHVLVPFGGAGPTHANVLAEEAGLRAIMVPPAAATFCALGAILSDIRRDFVRGLRRVAPADLAAAVWDAFAGLEAEAAAWLDAEGAETVGTRFEYGADMRYAGQSHNILVRIPAETRAAEDFAALSELFHRAHERLYGFRDQAPIEIVTVRASIIGHLPAVALPAIAGDGPAPTPRGRRPVFHAGRWDDVPVYRRESLVPGASIAGPLLVEQEDTTIRVLAGWRLVADRRGNLHIERTGA